MRGHFGELVFGTTIPRNVRIAEAPSHGLPVLIYDNACAGAQAYILLASEFIRRRRTAAEAAPARHETSHMSQSPKPRGLGRGLSALLGDEDVAATVAPPPAPRRRQRGAAPRRPRAVHPADRPSARRQVSSRARRFEDIDSAGRSRCSQFGLLQPILVRPVAGEPDAYEIIAGERRWRAAQKAQLHDVPVVVAAVRRSRMPCSSA